MVIMLLSSWVGGSVILCLSLMAMAARRMPQNECVMSESRNLDFGLSNASRSLAVAHSSVTA